ncbi:hypothetical protein PMI01_03155 [Caulobacter sp. AP07]|uniref:hypothetical protein n=1 Tax=Caulobacter sp. AP07 TaxID=1144304 RepID=UPI000271FCB2|nr:hypothetical protein [Caulobacter sp. AP07]EJL30378.1 hypothetical protein PMI01_03155 [Caulobacter sp. AP07]
MTSNKERIDLLSSLKLPDRYEPLHSLVGDQLANILVEPTEGSLDHLASVVDSVRSGGQGTLVPLAGESGAGKTTFAASANQWRAKDFTPTLQYNGAITFDALAGEVERFCKAFPANEKRVIPINVDHRESSPPSAEELSAIKRFLRAPPGGLAAVIFWPETDNEAATQIGSRYEAIAGRQPVKVLEINGPPRDTWADVAINTLRLTNSVDSLEGIGVDPRNYRPDEYPSLGEFLRQIKNDFNKNLFSLRKSLQKPVEVVIVIVSESDDPGVLSSLTNSSRYGLLDTSGLLAATPDSVIGKWWATRPGLLTRAIVQLNAHVLFLSPAATMSAIRNCGPTPDEFLDSLGVPRVGASRAVRDLGRTDVGKLLRGETLSRFEGRGTPAKDAAAAFQLLAERGFNLGKDKKLNSIMADAWRAFLAASAKEGSPEFIVSCEKILDFCQLIPDNAIIYNDSVIAIEYTWRKGEFLAPKYRSTVAQYILTKLQNYTRELGWAAE